MNKHQLLEVDINSSVKWSAAELKQMKIWLQRASTVSQILMDEGLVKDGGPPKIRVSLLLCGDARIKKLNFDYRAKDKITDVLSFPNADNLADNWKKETLNGELFLGDLALCIPQSKRQAREFNIGFWDEFIHLFFHGLLHLWGYDHERSARDEKIMQKWEDRSMELLSQVKSKKK